MGGSLSGWIAILSAILVFIIFGKSANWFETWPSWLQWLDDPQTQALIIVILVFGIIIWFITKDEKKEGPRGKFLSDIGDFFKGK
jgi:MFS superfamily sulfate permease-like transporter